MDFALTPAQQQKRDEFREFIQQYVEPVADQIDRSRRMPLTVVRHAPKHGYLAPTVPTEYGGSGYDMLTFSMLAKEIAKASLSLAIPFSIHTCLATDSILDAGCIGFARSTIGRNWLWLGHCNVGI